MKILIVSAYPPDTAPEANHALHLSEHLAMSGHAVHVLCRKGSIAATREGIVVHPIMDHWAWSALPRVATFLKSCRPDVVLLLYIGWVFDHRPFITFLPTLIRTVLPGVPCVTQFENVDLAPPRRTLMQKLKVGAAALWAGGKGVHPWLGTLLRDSARVITLSSPHLDRLVGQDPDVSEKSEIMPPPPLIRFCEDPPAIARRAVREAIGASETDFVLVYWGYIYPGKGVEILLQAFRTASGQNPNLRLVIVGGILEFPTWPISCGEYYRMVRGLPESLGISEKVTWTGHFDWNSDAGSRYLRAADACVLPFDYGVTLNNSSLAAASTHGVPVIGTELPEGRDAVLEHGRNIYLCRPRDPGGLAEAIGVISEAPDLRDRLRRGVLGLAREWYSWDKLTDRMVGRLKTEVSASGAPSAPERKGWTTEAVEWRGDGDSTALQPPIEANLETAPPPVVSVVVAAYQVGKYLSQCLDSLVHQTLKNIEILVVNDASTDDGPRIAKAYRSRYPNVRVIDCKRNVGLASVRNIGMHFAKGDYIAFVDGDDWADPGMCETMVRRAARDRSDVLIADANVFYEDSKTFGRFFDQPVRKILDPGLRTMPFDLALDPRVMLLEPVAWTKLYRRSFILEHGIQFEDGMNSYEDICFHFTVLIKAGRISLIDDAVSFYRQNRPGQISGRTSRKIFEVFDVFRKIRENLSAWSVTPEIWSMLVRVELRQFDWLLRDRVRPGHKREFLARVAEQFRTIPESGFRRFSGDADPYDNAKLFCMRRNWLLAYKLFVRFGWMAFPSGNEDTGERNRGGKRWGIRRAIRILRGRVAYKIRSLIRKSLGLSGLEEKLREVNDSVSQMAGAAVLRVPSGEPVVAACGIGDRVFTFSDPSHGPGFSNAVRKVQDDYYLSQTAVFREGDTVADIGAHVGIFSIYLAKKFPFIKIYAIEPDPKNFLCLKRNIEDNGVRNVTAVNKAVSGNARKGTLYVDARDSAWATVDSRSASADRVLRIEPVETLTLDQLFREYGIRHCRLLKISAPGALKEILTAFTRSGCVDLLCGDADLGDCGRAHLERASWRIARQHFWRTTEQRGGETIRAWIHQLPSEIERIPS